MRHNPVKEPQRIGEHVRFAIEQLRELGADHIRVFKTRHLHVVFNVGRHELTVHMACTPLNTDDAKAHFRQELTRTVKRALGAMA